MNLKGKEGSVFLLASTLLMVILLFTYSPKTEESVPALNLILEPISFQELELVQEKGLELYSVDAFRNSSISFVKANQNYDFVLYEVTGNGDFEKLKATLSAHLLSQGCEKKVMIFVLDESSPEVVKDIF